MRKHHYSLWDISIWIRKNEPRIHLRSLKIDPFSKSPTWMETEVLGTSCVALPRVKLSFPAFNCTVNVTILHLRFFVRSPAFAVTEQGIRVQKTI